jgi:RNA polymerase-associated protein
MPMSSGGGIMAIVAKRTVMSLFSDMQDIYSHQVRIVLAEKGVNVEIHPVQSDNLPEDLVDLNPYGSVPTLLDRELVLYESRIIMEYLDERFPHPPLLPVYPVARAETRKMMHRIDHDWYELIRNIQNNVDVEASRKQLLESLIGLEPIFGDKPFFLSDDFSLLDCVIAPLLWRLPILGIELPDNVPAIKNYMRRVFERESFKASLTEVEKELRAA